MGSAPILSVKCPLPLTQCWTLMKRDTETGTEVVCVNNPSGVRCNIKLYLCKQAFKKNFNVNRNQTWTKTMKMLRMKTRRIVKRKMRTKVLQNLSPLRPELQVTKKVKNYKFTTLISKRHLINERRRIDIKLSCLIWMLTSVSSMCTWAWNIFQMVVGVGVTYSFHDSRQGVSWQRITNERW